MKLKLSQTRLKNGVQVATAHLPHLSRAHVTVTLRCGPCHEDDETWGLSHFLEHMLFRGGALFPTARAISEAADDFGGEVEASTYRDRMVLETRCDPQEVDRALGVLADMMTAPRFSDIEVEREILREELLEYLDDEKREIDDENLIYREVFSGHPLARSIDGTLENLERFGRAHLRAFHRRHFVGENLVVAVAGPVPKSRVQKAARHHLGPLQAGRRPVMGVPPPKSRRRKAVAVVRQEESQTTFRLAFPCSGLNHPHRVPLALLGRILDDGPMSRLQSRLVDGQGLAYSLWAQASLYGDRGIFELGGQVQHHKVGEVMNALVGELLQVAKKTPPAQEIVRVKRRVARDLADLNDHPGHMADAVAAGLLSGRPFSPKDLMGKVQAVRGAALRNLAAGLFTADHARAVLVGKPSKRAIQQCTKALARLPAG
jgi:predicted Zn-dependent peptidase